MNPKIHNTSKKSKHFVILLITIIIMQLHTFIYAILLFINN